MTNKKSVDFQLLRLLDKNILMKFINLSCSNKLLKLLKLAYEVIT